MKLKIPKSIERRINAYVQAVPGEIAGMGELEVREDGNFWVTDIAIYEQEVTGGTADLSPEALAKFQTALIKAGKSPRNWYLWWHSHAGMPAFFSGTDTGTIDSSSEYPHILSLVVNKKGERKARFDTHEVNGIPMRMKYETMEVDIVPEINHETIRIDADIVKAKELIKRMEDEKAAIEDVPVESVAEEVATKVKNKVWTLPPWRKNDNKPNQGYLKEPFNEDWSKKRKKDGVVSTIAGVDTSYVYSEDELLLLIEETRNIIKAHEAHGNGDTVECEQLREDLTYYTDEYLETLNPEGGISETPYGLKFGY